MDLADYKQACRDYAKARLLSEYWTKKKKDARKQIERYHELSGVESMKVADGPWSSARVEQEVSIPPSEIEHFIRWVRKRGDGEIVKESISKGALKEYVEKLESQGVEVPHVKTHNRYAIRVHQNGWLPDDVPEEVIYGE